MSCAEILRLACCCVLLCSSVTASAVPAATAAAALQPGQAVQEFESVRVDFDIALATQESGELEKALPLWRDIVARVPDAATPLANLALVEMQLGQLEEAQKSMSAAIARSPQASFYNELGLIQRQQGDFEAARASYEQALILDESFARAHLNLAILCDLYLQDLPAALQHYRRYQELCAKEEKSAVTNWIGDLERRIKEKP